MRYIVFAIACLLSSAILACSKPENPATASKRYSAIVALVDSVNVPIANKILGEDVNGGAVEGEASIKLHASEVVFPKGVSASLIGTNDKPIAVILYSHADVETYYVPFTGVFDVDRPRRLTKLAERVYRLESNRSAEGVRVDRRLP